MSKQPGTYVLSPYTSFNVVGLITGADYSPKTKELVLIGYQSSHSNSFLWFLDHFTSDSFFSGNKRRIEIGNGKDWQTEGITWNSNGRILLSNENSGLPCSLYASDKNFKTSGIAATANIKMMMVYPNPANETLCIKNLVSKSLYTIFNLMGEMVLQGKIDNLDENINVQDLSTGSYVLIVNTSSGESSTIRFEKL